MSTMNSLLKLSSLIAFFSLSACQSSEQAKDEPSENESKEIFLSECQEAMAAEFDLKEFDRESYCECTYDVMSEYYQPEMDTVVRSEGWEAVMDMIYQQEGDAFLKMSQECILTAIDNKDMLLSEIEPEFYGHIVDGCVKNLIENGIQLPRTPEEYCNCYLGKIKGDVTVGDWYASVSDPGLLPQDAAYECLGMIIPPEQ